MIRRLRENFPILRDQFIRDILFGFLKDENAIWEKNEFLEVGLKKGSYTVLAVESEGFENETEEEKQLNSLKIKDYICDFCRKQSENVSFYLACIDRSRYAILINEHGNQAFNIMDFSETLKKQLSSQFNISFAMGISNTYNRITEVYRCYQEACDALKFKLYLGKNQIIYYSDIYRSSNGSAVVNTSTMQNDLKYLIMTGDKRQINHFVENLFEYEPFANKDYFIQYICLSIIYYLQINLLELNEKPGNITEELFITSDKFYKLKTVEGAKNWLKNLIWSVSSYLNSKDKQRNKKVIEVLKTFMHEHYNEDLSVSEIAEKAYLSPCYANYIFKKETGFTLMEYLTKIRIEEAKRLLRDSLLKVYEIADKVGYKSSSYFSAVFKEHCKMTPLEFRDRR